MRMPGFTAKASLSDTLGACRSGSGVARSPLPNVGIEPAVRLELFPRDPCQQCKDAGLACYKGPHGYYYCY